MGPPLLTKSAFLSSNTVAADRKETASGLFKKLASKLKSPALGQLNATSTTTKATSSARVKSSPPLPSDFTCKEQREAALRARGLIVAPKKDLSEVEQDLDRRYAKTKPVPQEQTTEDGQPSAAEKIMQEWKAKNIAGGGL